MSDLSTLERPQVAPQPMSTVLDHLRRTEPQLDAQEAFLVPEWFCDQHAWVQDPRASSSSVYNLPLCLHVKGALNREALEAALHEMQHRHSPLRSIFRAHENRLVQVVLPRSTTSLTIVEPDTRDPQHLEAMLQEHAARPFDLTREPALRAVLFPRGDESVLLITAHHLICDDWSTGILLQELFAFYRAYTESAATPAPLGDSEYAAFIRWHEERLSGPELQSKLAFWKDALGGREFYHLKTDAPRPARRTYGGQTVRKMLPGPLAGSLRRFSQQSRVSLFMTLLAGLQCVLQQRSGDTDIAIGSCAANRMLSSVEGLIGRFANDLVVRTDFSGNPTFRELLTRVRNRALMAYSHQDVPFAGLLGRLGVPQPADRTPLFQVMFILQDAPKQNLQVPGLAISQLPFDLHTGKYDLCVFAGVRSGLELSLEYNTDIFTSATIADLLAAYERTLAEMVNNPVSRIGRSAALAAKPPRAKVAEFPEAPANDSVASRLRDIWRKCFRLRTIGLDQDFFELGGDSLLAARLFAQVRQEFDVSLPVVTLTQAPTIRKLAAALCRTAAPCDLESVVPLQPEGSRPPLFCAHGESGELLIYRSLAQHLGPDQPVYGLQPRGMDGRRPPLDNVEAMAAQYIREVRVVQPWGPYFLVGYCMGGSIALEIAQQLIASGDTVGMVAMLDSYNVVHLRPGRHDRTLFNLQKVWFGLRHFLGATSRHKLEFLRRRIEQVRIPRTLVADANTRAALSYTPKPYPGRLLHVRPRHQYSRYGDAALQWDALAAQGLASFTLPIVPGQMFEEPHVRELACILTAAMDRALRLPAETAV